MSDKHASTSDGLGYQGRLLYGVKIVKDLQTSEIQILSTMSGGTYYQPISEADVEVFVLNGWRFGVYAISVRSYSQKLSLIRKKIRDEANGRQSAKRMEALKERRDNILKIYTEIKNKFNKIKDYE